MCSSALMAQVEPVPLRVSGRIPKWLDGVLLKNGPGTFKDKQASEAAMYIRAHLKHLQACHPRQALSKVHCC